MRRFILLRVEDVSGSSGTGKVAEGVVASNGWAIVVFADSFKFFPSVEKLMDVHSHEGRTRLHYMDAEHKPATESARTWQLCPPPKEAGLFLLRRAPGVLSVVGIHPEYEDGLEEHLDSIRAASEEDGGWEEETLLAAIAEGMDERTNWVVSFGADTDYFTVEEFTRGEWSRLRL